MVIFQAVSATSSQTADLYVVVDKTKKKSTRPRRKHDYEDIDDDGHPPHPHQPKLNDKYIDCTPSKPLPYHMHNKDKDTTDGHNVNSSTSKNRYPAGCH